MKVEIWCGVGGHRLERAVERFGHGEHVEVAHRSFPLGSGFPEGSTFTVRDALQVRYGMGGGQVEVSARRTEALAESGAVFRTYFGRAEPVFSLEDLLTLAGERGLDRERTRRAALTAAGPPRRPPRAGQRQRAAAPAQSLG
ncbi:thioredoxin domain-containing protein [Spongiactinospora rosea]|uniref:hypothetical protein n=1 Tax=Spongiactinospora rosea TaxID=2248750 RepID=UPI0018F74D50|nr:hypothetical protein [Spongiactinospora rosea]